MAELERTALIVQQQRAKRQAVGREVGRAPREPACGEILRVHELDAVAESLAERQARSRVDVAGDERGIVEQVSASALLQPQRIETDPPANDPEDLARQQPRQLRARGRGIRRHAEELLLGLFVGHASRLRPHVTLAGAARRALQLDLDRRAADPRFGEEAEVRRDGARVREVDDEPFDAVGVAREIDLAVGAGLDASDHTRPFDRAHDPEAGRDVQAPVVVVDANVFDRGQREIEPQSRKKRRHGRRRVDALAQAR